jgi:hypothetical protein
VGVLERETGGRAELGVSQWIIMLNMRTQAMTRAWEMMVDGEREENEGNGRETASG